MSNVEENNNDNYEKFLDNNLSRIYTNAEIFLDTIRYVPDGLISIGYYVFPINDITLPMGITDNFILISTESSNIFNPKNFIFKDYDAVRTVGYKLQTFISQVKILFDLSFVYKDEIIYLKNLIKCDINFKNQLVLDVNQEEGKIKQIYFNSYLRSLILEFNNIISRFRYINHGGVCIEEMENHFKFIEESINEIKLLLK